MSSYRIGVDGGATKTECLLVDARGAVVWCVQAGGSNPNVAGPEKARATVGEVIEAARAEAVARGGAVEATLFCMSGVPALWGEFAANLKGFGRTRAEKDSLPVLELATDGEPGLALHGGTGSFVVARAPDGEVHYAGGTGWRFGDPGSGYDLGRRAIGRALLELQGWSSGSQLGDALCEYTGLRVLPEITRFLYQHPEPNRLVAGFAREVLRLADSGTGSAQDVVRESCLSLLQLAETVADRLFPGAPRSSLRAGLSGPVMTHPASMAALAGRTEFVLTPHVEPPSEGVRRLLVKM